MSHADDLTLSGAIGDEAALRRSASNEARTGIRNIVRAELVWVIGAAAAWLVSAALMLQLPNTMEFAYTEIFAVILAGTGLLWKRSGFTVLLVTHDVEEALFLADRVVVLSDRPANIRDIVTVDQPHPRRRDDAELVALRRRVLDLMGVDEALHS